jgi:hypothetical protein
MYYTNNSPVSLEAPERSTSSSRGERTTHHGTSPAFRRISQVVRRAAENEDAIVQPTTFSTRPPKPTVPQPATCSTGPDPISTTKFASHVAIPAKKPRGRPRKSPKAVAASRPAGTITLKRKPSLGSQPYETPKSSIKKVLRDTKRRKSVGFVETPIALEEDSEDPNYPASPVRRPTRGSGGSASKAAKAGKMSKARVGSVGGRVAGGKMTTRSGKAYY